MWHVERGDTGKALGALPPRKHKPPPKSSGLLQVKSYSRHVSVTLTLAARRSLSTPNPASDWSQLIVLSYACLRGPNVIGRPVVRWEISGDAGEVGTCFTASKFSQSPLISSH